MYGVNQKKGASGGVNTKHRLVFVILDEISLTAQVMSKFLTLMVYVFLRIRAVTIVKPRPKSQTPKAQPQPSQNQLQRDWG